MTDSTLFFWQTQILSNSLFKWGLWIYFINFGNRLCFIKKTLLRHCEPIAQAFLVTFALVSSFSPGVSLRANVPLWAPMSCHGPASATPRFNQALGSEIWAWRAGCTRAPFIWFQSSLRPRMWLRGHSFSRRWGGRWGTYLFGGVWKSASACARLLFGVGPQEWTKGFTQTILNYVMHKLLGRLLTSSNVFCYIFHFNWKHSMFILYGKAAFD